MRILLAILLLVFPVVATLILLTWPIMDRESRAAVLTAVWWMTLAYVTWRMDRKLGEWRE